MGNQCICLLTPTPTPQELTLCLRLARFLTVSFPTYYVYPRIARATPFFCICLLKNHPSNIYTEDHTSHTLYIYIYTYSSHICTVFREFGTFYPSFPQGSDPSQLAGAQGVDREHLPGAASELRQSAAAAGGAGTEERRPGDLTNPARAVRSVQGDSFIWENQ